MRTKNALEFIEPILNKDGKRVMSSVLSLSKHSNDQAVFPAGNSCGEGNIRPSGQFSRRQLLHPLYCVQDARQNLDIPAIPFACHECTRYSGQLWRFPVRGVNDWPIIAKKPQCSRSYRHAAILLSSFFLLSLPSGGAQSANTAPGQRAGRVSFRARCY